MLGTYSLNGNHIDSLDLKSMVVSRGVKVSSRIYKKLGKDYRIYPDPLKCNCFILPDGTIIHITDLAFHLSALKSMLSWDSLQQMKYSRQMNTPFSLDISDSQSPTLFFKGEKVTEVRFPKATSLYAQKTSEGLPFLGNAVLQGTQWLSFQCLWVCDYACAGKSCQFCYSGATFYTLTKKKKKLPRFPTPKDVAEIVEYTVIKEKCATSIQITGGSSFNVQAEYDRIRRYLNAIDTRIGRKNIPGELHIYTTPPNTPQMVDQLFEAGADRIACSIEVCNEELAKLITPGKTKYTGRKPYLESLEYIANKYGPNKACSSLVVGVEPADSYLEGAEYLASRGIVPLASIWIPFGRPVMGKIQAPDLSFYRKVKTGLDSIYQKYGIEPPGEKGLNVCLCRDTCIRKEEILTSNYK